MTEFTPCAGCDEPEACEIVSRCLEPEAVSGWQPIETAPKHEEVLVWREDAGTMLGIYTYCADWLSEKEQDEMDEDTLFKEDWWWFGPHGVCRMEGSEVPTHWMPLPDGPAS